MEKKKGFFKKAWTSIRDFEKYEEFAADTVFNAIKYILILTLIFTIIIALAYTYKFHTVLVSVKDYINQNIEEIGTRSQFLLLGNLDQILISAFWKK